MSCRRLQQRLWMKTAVCLLCCACSQLPTGFSAHYRGGGGGGGPNGSHEVRVQLTQLKLADFSHRGSLHVDRIELRSEEQDRNAFFVHNPTDPNYPLWAAARASVAAVWPQPRREERRKRRRQPPPNRWLGRRGHALRLAPRLRIRLLGGCETNDVVRLAVRRFARTAFASVTAVSDSADDAAAAEATGRGLAELAISVRNTSYQRYPHLDMREDYELTVDAAGIRLLAHENWGTVRGLETLAQLIFVSRQQPNKFLIHENQIEDSPAFKYRGLMLDTARHFIQKTTILENLEAMTMNKMNVFHWHIVDDQSFPYMSKKFPQLAQKSAYAGGRYFYTAEDIGEIVEFARLRGIRVVPEFDTPDHTHSWGHALPDIVSWCSVGQLAYTGPLNPTSQGTFEFLSEFYAEVAQVFPDSWLHLGMDEVSADCWRLNATVEKFMRANKLTTHDQLVAYYANRLAGIIHNLPVRKNVMVWEDILGKDSAQYPLKLPQDAIVQVWITRDSNKLAEWQKRYRLVRSEDWYLDHHGYGADWVKRYRFSPGPRDLGGEACMWTEFQSDSTVTQRTWPSVSAVAERLWSGDAAKDPVEAAPRVEEQNCRMHARGIRVGVAGGPGMCQKPVADRPPVWLDEADSDSESRGASSAMWISVSSDRGSQCWLFKWGSIALAVGYLLHKTIRWRAASAGAANQRCLRLPAAVAAGCRSLARQERILCCFLLFYCAAWLLVQLELW